MVIHRHTPRTPDANPTNPAPRGLFSCFLTHPPRIFYLDHLSTAPARSNISFAYRVADAGRY